MKSFVSFQNGHYARSTRLFLDDVAPFHILVDEWKKGGGGVVIYPHTVATCTLRSFQLEKYQEA